MNSISSYKACHKLFVHYSFFNFKHHFQVFNILNKATLYINVHILTFIVFAFLGLLTSEDLSSEVVFLIFAHLSGTLNLDFYIFDWWEVEYFHVYFSVSISSSHKLSIQFFLTYESNVIYCVCALSHSVVSNSLRPHRL